MTEFNPPKYKCKNCGDIIWSRSEGEFRTCKCYTNTKDNTGIAVDSTKYYTRRIGNPNNFEEIK